MLAVIVDLPEMHIPPWYWFRIVSRIRQSMKSPGIFHLSRGIRNSSTRKCRRITGNRQSTALVSEVERWYLNLPQLYLLNHNGT